MRIAFPGLFDLQVNGFGGVDFNAPDLTADRVHLALERMRRVGVTRVLPTLITSAFEDFAASARVLAAMTDAAIAGIHMEGPYISPDDGPRGRASARAREAGERRRLRSPAGRGRRPHRARHAGARSARRARAHRAARVDRRARGDRAHRGEPAADRRRDRAGATLSTHLGNGCASMLPRHPNVIWEQLAADALVASLIVDGHHLPPATVKAMVRAKGAERTILVTDAMAAAGGAPGRYRIGAVECELGADGRVSLPGTPFLAGSSLTLDRAIANTVRFTGLPIDERDSDGVGQSRAVPGDDNRRHGHRRLGPGQFALTVLTVDRVRPGSDRGQTRVRPRPSDPRLTPEEQTTHGR